jgi:hypothetical protein
VLPKKCKHREIRRSQLYEALEFLEKNIDAAALLKNIAMLCESPSDEWQKEQP